jgi:hypothetical protein|tara:strand:- start:665 stop:961 length:297 start_codon:yes stop_codon:yes gene_type:complete
MAKYTQKPGRGKLNSYSAFEKRGLINSQSALTKPGHPKLRKAVNKVKSNVRTGVQKFKAMSNFEKMGVIGSAISGIGVAALGGAFAKQKKERQDPNWR